MRVVKFGAANVGNELAQMSGSEIDDLAFGAIQLAADGTVLQYNAAEAEIVGRDRDEMVGKNFFTDVAPCTRSADFEGRFLAGVQSGELDTQFIYVFDYEMTPTRVNVHMIRAGNKGSYWVLVKRVEVAAAR